MRKGSKHNWAYRGKWFERKKKPGLWIFSFKATKNQKPRRGVKPGSRYKWRINATQTAVKTKKGRYQTKMVGTKRLIKSRVRRRFRKR
jgi:hypothetical protein